jgi:hypothetical protein
LSDDSDSAYYDFLIPMELEIGREALITGFRRHMKEMRSFKGLDPNSEADQLTVRMSIRFCANWLEWIRSQPGPRVRIGIERSGGQR